jgi:hypothetical protein
MTAQIPEQLILDGAQVGMTCCPPLPEGHPRVIEVARDQRPRTDVASLAHSTACWRRYIGTWEVRRHRLYLTDLVGRYELTAGGPLPAEWVTGVLRIPRGEPLRYVHMGFASVFGQELHVRIERGLETGRRVVHYDADGDVVDVTPDGQSDDDTEWPDDEW